MIKSHKDLIVWQRGVELTLLIYRITKTFPKDELYGLTSQIRRASISIPANIAEGRVRGTRKDFVHFLTFSLGSVAELETHLFISKQLSFIKEVDYNKATALLIEIGKMLNAMISKLEASS